MTNTLPSREFNCVSSDVANDHNLSTGNLSLVNFPLVEGEDADDLEQFRASAIDAIRPRDAIEAIWLQDFICYAWESMRLRRQKPKPSSMPVLGCFIIECSNTRRRILIENLQIIWHADGLQATSPPKKK